MCVGSLVVFSNCKFEFNNVNVYWIINDLKVEAVIVPQSSNYDQGKTLRSLSDDH